MGWPMADIYKANRNVFALSRRFRRSGNVASPMDFGILVAVTGIGRGWRVIEAGCGSGFLTAFLSNSVGQEGRIVTYEVREEAVRIARSNLALAGAENVELVEGPLSVVEHEHPFDLACLDMRDADAALPGITDALRKGGWVFVYSPFMEQVAAIHRAAGDLPLKNIITFEPLVREMHVDDRGTRGRTQFLGQARFLTFAQKA